MKCKRLTAALCAAAMAAGMAGVPAVGEVLDLGTALSAVAIKDGIVIVDSGKCGDNLTWTLDEYGTLTISGTGRMKDLENWEEEYWDFSSSESLYPQDDVKNVIIGDGVTHIGKRAFVGFDFVNSITLPDSVTSIGDDAFSNCSHLTSVTIPNSVTSIGDIAFYNCNELKSITIPEGVTSIGTNAFSECEELESVTIPDSVKSIGNCAFTECSKLKSIKIPDGVTTIGYGTFWDCPSLESVALPDSLVSIGDYAFCDCLSLKSVDIPDSVTSIGEYAFYNTAFSDVYIPASVKSIGKYVFGYADAIYGHKSLVRNDDFVIRCCKDTAAVEYALENGFAFELTDGDYTEVIDINVVPSKLNATKIAYTGKPKTPGVNIMVGNKKLVKGTDFTATYSNNVKPGKATVKVTGIGKYTGTKTFVFYIVPKKAKLNSVTAKGLTKITVNWKKDPLADGYQVQVSNYSNFCEIRKSFVIKKNTTVKKTIVGLKPGNNYYVRVRAYKKIGNTRRFGAYSTTKYTGLG